MKNFKRKWLSSVLVVLLVVCMFAGMMPQAAFALETEQTDGTPVETPVENPENAPVEDPDQTPVEDPDQTPVEDPDQTPVEDPDETPVEDPDQTPEDEIPIEEDISLYVVRAEDAKETAVTTAPDALVMDGTKSYVIFTACKWGGHTYAIGPDGTATAELGIAKGDREPEHTVYLAEAGLGWTLRQSESGLVMENNGRYLTVVEAGLSVTDEETVSGLSILPNGVIALVNAGTETVYLHEPDVKEEPQKGDSFKVATDGTSVVFYFAEVQEPEQPTPSGEVLFEELLPAANFRAEIVSPDHVYGDDQYVIFTAQNGSCYALTGTAQCSAPLALEAAPAVGVRLRSESQNVLWTVNNNRGAEAAEGYYKYIRSCATNAYLAAAEGLLTADISDDFYLADRDGTSALLATADGRYVTLMDGKFSLTADKNAASRFYFAKLLQKEQQESTGDTTPIPEGTLLRLVDWSSVESGKTYAIINATELNKMHYALSGNGRLARYGADNLTQNSLCDNMTAIGPYGSQPCAANVGDVFYTNGQDILWTASLGADGQVAFQNAATGLYLNPSDGVAASQTPSISKDPAYITVETEGSSWAYLQGETGNYLGIWQYVLVGVDASAQERCAYYLAEVLSDRSELPATSLEQDSDPKTVSFGGLYSIYQGSQHLLNDATGVESFILMDDGTGSFQPENPQYNLEDENNFYVTYCADYDADMPTFTTPGQYRRVSLDAYSGFSDEQKAALKAIIVNSYPYVTEEDFLANLKEAGFEVSANCGVDEIMAGIQAAIYTVTNPREDGQPWGYESSDGWAHNSYEVNKQASYVSDPAQAESDVNNVRDYLWSFVTPVAAMAENSGATADDREYFAITTEIGGHTWALTFDNVHANENSRAYLMPYDPEDISQLWYEDEEGSLRWFPGSIYRDNRGNEQGFYLNLNPISGGEGNKLTTYGEYDVRDSYYTNPNTGKRLPRGYVPVKLDGEYLEINDYDRLLNDYGPRYSLSVSVTNGTVDSADYYYENNWTLSLNRINVYYAPNTEDYTQLTFEKKPITPQVPYFVEYELDKEDWTITYNEDGTYNVEINGRLNFPIRKDCDNVSALLFYNDEL